MTSDSTVTVEVHDEVAVVRMSRGKGNALNPEMVEDLLDALRQEQVVEDSRALVLAGADGFFSAGLDLVSLADLGRGRLLAFLDRLQGLMATLYVWNRPLVAAVNGHAVAGGCLLALCADWRVAGRGKQKMGLNEIELGLPLPQAGLEIARAQLTPHAWAEVVYGGEMHEADRARELGLVDELVDESEVLERAIDKARAWGARPRVAFHRVKASLRDRVLLKIRENHEQQQEEWVSMWFSPQAQDRIREIRDRLTAKEKGAD